ncbi:MAG TPA: DUF3311 domain-containing protein [Rhizomicrobium sp.]|nr:DUF3311 domain-containing protein [Rhizomicrobium sp.]
MEERTDKRPSRFRYALLAAPFVAMLAVPSYNRIDPQLAGVPFFYWYQLLWIGLGALLLALVRRAERRRNDPS